MYTDLTGPVNPTVRRCFKYVRRFIGDFAQMKEIFLLKSKSDAAFSLHQYNMAIAGPLGRRVQRLRADKGGEFISNKFTQLFLKSGTTTEYAATAVP